MAYRKRQNQNDRWQAFRESQRKAIQQLELPEWVWRNHEGFVELLTTGTGVGVNLSQMSDETFSKLESLVNVYFDDGWDQVACSAFHAERNRRFQRYG